MSKTLSIVVPAYNEAERIDRSLRSIVDYMARLTFACELVVVDDGSTDDTAARVEELIRRVDSAVSLVRVSPNRGKGYAVRQGILAANGEYVLFTDADLSAPIDEADKLLSALQRGAYDVAVGSRGIDRALIKKRQAFIRQTLGRCFNVAIRQLTGLPLLDTQCGFKALRREAVVDLVRAMRVDGFGFDVEFLGLCQAANLRMVEIGVVWRHAGGSKVHVGPDGVRMLAEALGFVLRLKRGTYNAALRAATAKVSKGCSHGKTNSS